MRKIFNVRPTSDSGEFRALFSRERLLQMFTCFTSEMRRKQPCCDFLPSYSVLRVVKREEMDPHTTESEMILFAELLGTLIGVARARIATSLVRAR